MLSRWSELAFGVDRTHRLRVQRTALALALYATCAALVDLGNGSAADLLPREYLLTAMLSGPLLFYVLVRSGWSLCLNDPALTVAQHVYGTATLLFGYAILGSERGLGLVLLSMLPLFGFMALSPRQIWVLAGVAIAAFAPMMLVMAQTAPERFDPRVELLHLVNTVVCLLGMSVVLAKASSLRARVREQRRELNASLARIEAISNRDELTGLSNRRRTAERLDSELRRAARLHQSHALWVALFDLDHFKRINDTLGHAHGDVVLREFARTMSVGLPDTHVFGRWGGEEFLLLMPNATHIEAEALIDAMRRRLAQTDLHCGVVAPAVTFSAGLAVASNTVAEVLERADQALYRAKADGRNRTVRHDD